MLQLSGLTMTYDLSQPEYHRIVTLQRNGQSVADDDRFTVAASGFLTEGGDLYDSFPESEVIRSVGKVSDVVIQYFRDHELVTVPVRGRQWPVADGD
jgi:2',3'-cyclic-nucleotide 2'-phosphodiesterase (5'-nucleotidase family)